MLARLVTRFGLMGKVTRCVRSDCVEWLYAFWRVLPQAI